MAGATEGNTQRWIGLDHRFPIESARQVWKCLTLFLFLNSLLKPKPAAGIGVESLPTKVGINSARTQWRELVTDSPVTVLPEKEHILPFSPTFLSKSGFTPLPMLARRAAALISTITINVVNTEKSTFSLFLLAFRGDFEEKCKKGG